MPKKPTLEDIVRIGSRVQSDLRKEKIGIRVLIESFPLDTKVEDELRMEIAGLRKSLALAMQGKPTAK